VALLRADDLIVLVPLPGDDHDVARRGLDDRRFDRARAIELEKIASLPFRDRRQVRRAPRSIGRAIASGLSLRGLSLVMIAASTRRATASPIGARFEASRSPPQPNTHQTRRPATLFTLSRTLARASGVCA
jgi:hypothetical protein